MAPQAPNEALAASLTEMSINNTAARNLVPSTVTDDYDESKDSAYAMPMAAAAPGDQVAHSQSTDGNAAQPLVDTAHMASPTSGDQATSPGTTPGISQDRPPIASPLGARERRALATLAQEALHARAIVGLQGLRESFLTSATAFFCPVTIEDHVFGHDLETVHRDFAQYIDAHGRSQHGEIVRIVDLVASVEMQKQISVCIPYTSIRILTDIYSTILTWISTFTR